VLQMFMPQLSFGGHLAGIAVGTLQLYGFLNILIPKESYLLEMDSWSSLRWLSSSPSFVATTSASETVTGDLASARQGIRRGLSSVTSLLRNVLDSLKVIVFGRGAEANSNIQLGGWTRASATDEADDDDNWGGLPPISDRDASSHLV
jgi:rhomboid domain-containing protein 1